MNFSADHRIYQLVDFINNPKLFLNTLNSIFLEYTYMTRHPFFSRSVNLRLAACGFKSLSKQNVFYSKVRTSVDFVKESTIQPQTSYSKINYPI